MFEIDESLEALVEAAEQEAEANNGEISGDIKTALATYAEAFGYKVDRIANSYGPKTQFLPFSAISGIEWRLYEASYATGRLWPDSLWRRSRIRRSTQLGRSFRIFRIVKLGVLGFRCVRRFFRQWPANSCSATFIAENSTAQAAAR
jgi:hypothetical protein